MISKNRWNNQPWRHIWLNTSFIEIQARDKDKKIFDFLQICDFLQT